MYHQYTEWRTAHRCDCVRRHPGLSRNGAARSGSERSRTWTWRESKALSGVLLVSPQTGATSTLAPGGNLIAVTGVALDASGAIYATASGASALKTSATKSQRFARSGIAVSASRKPHCWIGYDMQIIGLPYAADTFDIVYCISVFTHLDDALAGRGCPA